MPNDNAKYDAHYKLLTPYFDSRSYIENYGQFEETDLADPLTHYLKIGAKKGYNPNPFFDSNFYLHANKDIAQAGMNPFVHYLGYGFREGRLPISNNTISTKICGYKISDPAMNLANWRIPCIINADLSDSALDINEITKTINATEATATILNRDSKDWLIVFSGRGENFYYLNKMKSFWGNVLFLRDTSATYYSQNPNLPAAHLISAYIDYLTGPRTGKTIIVGQSSGGHAALYQSSFIQNALTFGFSPQAYHPDLYPHNLYFEEGINKAIPTESAPDLVARLQEITDGPRYVVVGKSESSHEDSYYWGDTLSAGVIAATGKCSVIVVNRKEHPTIQYLDTPKLFNLLQANYDLFLNNRHAASKLFCSSALYYIKPVSRG